MLHAGFHYQKNQLLDLFRATYYGLSISAGLLTVMILRGNSEGRKLGDQISWFFGR